MNKHKHHIIPRCLGGSDDPSNIVELTYEEHVEAHRLLHLANIDHVGLRKAYYMMKGITAEEDKELKSLAGKIGGKITGPKNIYKAVDAIKGKKRDPLLVQRTSSFNKRRHAENAPKYKWSHPKYGEMFCRLHDIIVNFNDDGKLSKGLLCQVAKGNRSHHKQWRVIK